MFNRIASSGVSWLGLSVLILLGDRLSKDWVLAHLIPGEPLKIFPFLNFTLVHNTGAAFGFLHTAAGWQNLFLGSLAVMVSAAVVRIVEVQIHLPEGNFSTTAFIFRRPSS